MGPRRRGGRKLPIKRDAPAAAPRQDPASLFFLQRASQPSLGVALHYKMLCPTDEGTRTRREAWAVAAVIKCLFFIEQPHEITRRPSVISWTLNKVILYYCDCLAGGCPRTNLVP